MIRNSVPRFLWPWILASIAAAAEKTPAPQLVAMASHEAHSPAFRKALTDTLGVEELTKGTAFIGEGADFLWAVDSGSTPSLVVDEEPQPPMKRIKGTNLWFATGKLSVYAPHGFHYMVDGKKFGGSLNVSAYGPDSYPKAGVPQGKLSEKTVHKSRIYDGMLSDWWIYVPAQYDAAKPAALMVWQDGQGHISRTGGPRTMNVVDNLTHQGRIPVMIQVFISPGDIAASEGTPTHTFVSNFSKVTRRTLKDSMRSVEYDTVSDRYARFLREEIIPEVASKYSIRKDAYSHGTQGNSSGAIAAFNAAWFQPDLFSRVLSHIGTYTSIQWQPGAVDGGNIYPFKVRKEDKRNLRVWLQDGSEDIESNHGSWPLQNIQMANSLKMRGYDFHFSFGAGPHSGAHGNAELPLSLAWLWRDYDPARTEQIYEMEAAEREKPLFRVKIANR